MQKELVQKQSELGIANTNIAKASKTVKSQPPIAVISEDKKERQLQLEDRIKWLRNQIDDAMKDVAYRKRTLTILCKPCSNSRYVMTYADRSEANPFVSVSAGVVLQQINSATCIRENIEPAVVVVINKGSAAHS